MKIMYLVWNVGCYGATRTILEHCQRLKLRGHEVYLGTKEPGQNYDWFEADVKIPIVPIDSVTVDVAVATWYRTAFWLDEVRCKRRAYFIQADDRLAFGGDREAIEESFHVPMDIYLTPRQRLKAIIESSYGLSPTVIEHRVNIRHFFPDPVLRQEKKVVLIEGSLFFPIFRVREMVDVAKKLDSDVWLVTYTPDITFDKSGVDRFWGLPSQKVLRQIYSSADLLLKSAYAIQGSVFECLVCGTGSVVSVEQNEWPATEIDSGISIVGYENWFEMESVARERLLSQIPVNGNIAKRLTDWSEPIELLEKSIGGEK